MIRAHNPWRVATVLALSVALALVGGGCDQDEEECWIPSGEAVPVTTDTLTTDHLSPAISPDGTRVAFSTDFWATEDYDDENRRDIAVIDLPGPDEIRRPVRRLFDIGNAKRIVFSSLPTDTGLPFSNFGTKTMAEPAWHPDGVRMAAVVPNDNSLDRIFIFQPLFAGATQQEIEVTDPVLIDDVDLGADLFNNQYYYRTPAFSPDGEWIAYSRYFFKPADEANDLPAVTQKPAIYAYNLSDGRVVQVTRRATVSVDPAWSPDGTEIVFTSNRGTASGQTEIFRVPFDPDNPATDDADQAVRLTFTDTDPRPKVPVGAMHPTWMASGEIVFASTQRPPCSSQRDRNLWGMSPSGGDARVIWQTRTDDHFPVADPTGSNSVVFVTRINQAQDFFNQKSDLWVLRNF